MYNINGRERLEVELGPGLRICFWFEGIIIIFSYFFMFGSWSKCSIKVDVFTDYRYAILDVWDSEFPVYANDSYDIATKQFRYVNFHL